METENNKNPAVEVLELSNANLAEISGGNIGQLQGEMDGDTGGGLFAVGVP